MAGTAGGPSLSDNLPVLGDVVVGYAVDRDASKLPLGATGGLDLRHCSGVSPKHQFSAAIGGS